MSISKYETKITNTKADIDSLTKKINKLYTESQEQYKSGDKALAKKLSDEAKLLKEEKNNLHEKLTLYIEKIKALKTEEINSIKENKIDINDIKDRSNKELSELLDKIKDKNDKLNKKIDSLKQESKLLYETNKTESLSLNHESNILIEKLKISKNLFRDIVNLLNKRKEDEKLKEKNNPKQYNYNEFEEIVKDLKFNNLLRSENYNELYNQEKNDSDIEEKLDNTALELRNRAKEYALKMKSCFEKSQTLFENNNKSEAKIESENGKLYQHEMIKYNKKAEDYIFNLKNEFRSENEIDLHGLFVNEAIDKLKERIKIAEKGGVKNENKILVVIHGKGSHSKSNLSRIKILCYVYLDENKLRYEKNSPNEGCLTIFL